MTAVRAEIRKALGVLAVVAIAVLAVSSAASAAPWWRLSSYTRPANIQPGAARNEVQEIDSKPVEFNGHETVGFELEAKGHDQQFYTEPVAAELGKPAATAANLQAALDTAYGVGNTIVTGGPAGSAPFVIEFVGEDADQAPLQPVRVSSRIGTSTVKTTSEGRPDGEIVVLASNLGDETASPGEDPAKIADELPAGLQALSIRARPAYLNSGKFPCVLATLTCEVTEGLPPYAQVEVAIPVNVKPGAAASETNEATIVGGGAATAYVRRPVRIANETPGFGVEEYEMTPEEEGGRIDTQAGSHPFQLTTSLTLNQTLGRRPEPVGNVKDLAFKLPPGLVGNPTPFPQCPIGEFLHVVFEGNACSPQTAVGVAEVTVEDSLVGHLAFSEPLFNLEPAVGEPARFGFYVVIGQAPVILDTSVATGGDYHVNVDVHNITQTIGFLSSQVTFWGVPGDPRHDKARGWGCLEYLYIEESAFPCSPEGEVHPPPLLSLPTACEGPLQSTVEADTWADKGVFGAFSSEPMPSMDGCNRLPFTPSVKVTPDGQAGSTPTGLTVDEHVSQLSTLAPEGLAESDVKGLSVTLPQGVAVNPAAADGLQACSIEQIGLQNGAATACPDAAKVATVKVKTPLLPDALEGAAYLATQDANPFGSLVALYVYAEDPIAGVRVKAAGEVLEDPVTGQLTAHFEGNPLFSNNPLYAHNIPAQFLPPLPFEDVELHFFGGDRAPLATPSKCGGYTTTGTFTPWSGNPTVESSSEFKIVSGPNGSACKDPLPFAPSLTAGTTSIQAGGFSPFTMTMTREDGQQSLQSVKLTMPPGMSGTLSTVKLCGEAQADAGTCGPESLIGHTIVSVGVGGDPYTVTGGEVFITGPYKGAPYGLSIVNPAKAGPFDLGKVIVRAKIEVDQKTAQLTVVTDNEGPYKIPTIIDGIPLQIRHVNVTVDRPGFAFNPTNCSPLAITGSLTSSEGASAALSVPFQATNCAVLAFKPKLTASTSGRTSRANGASFTVKLGYPAGPYDANISRVKVELPKALPSRLTTLQKACLSQVFEANPAGCPAASIVGHATATTPVLPVALSGPAYFVSHGNEAFPSLVIVLQGYGVTVDLEGTTFISKKGITSSTFKTVPDVPVGTFELTLPQGPYSALTANTDLCKAKSLAMPTEFVGQNGALIKTNTKIQAAGCPKAKKAAHKHKKKPRKGARTRSHGAHGKH